MQLVWLVEHLGGRLRRKEILPFGQNDNAGANAASPDATIWDRQTTEPSGESLRVGIPESLGG